MSECVQGQVQALDSVVSERIAAMFKALSDPTRIRIIAALEAGELCVHGIADLLAMSQSAISHQLRGLRHQGIVVGRRDGRHVYYRLADDHIGQLYAAGRDHALHEAPHQDVE